MLNTVYKITNKVNGRFYIGSTHDLEYRLKVHFTHKRASRVESDFYRDIDVFKKGNFKVESLLETEDSVLASREESRLIRENMGDELLYNKMVGASGRRVFYESDIIFIRELYNSKKLYINEAYEMYYKNIVSHRAFKKVWHGDTFKDTHYEVYTEENKAFHFALGQSRRGEINGKAVYKEFQVLDIRQRKKRGEDKQSVYKDYEYLNARGGFDMIWINKNWKYIQAN